MDDIVKQAMVKWPNVPHCYGWLALDGRGYWRMRDEQAQSYDSPGEKIVHPALLGFINRNYEHDQCGCWYFQNGPQRVYVDLAIAPYIVRADPVHVFVDQTGQAWPDVDAVWMTETGQLLLQSVDKIAMVDDRDLAQCLPSLQCDGDAVNDDRLMAWLNEPAIGLTWSNTGHVLPVQRVMADKLAEQFGFVSKPRSLE